MRRLGRNLSRGFISIMLLLGAFGVGLFLLAKIAEFSGRSSVTAPVGAAATRYRQFATTGQ